MSGHNCTLDFETSTASPGGKVTSTGHRDGSFLEEPKPGMRESG